MPASAGTLVRVHWSLTGERGAPSPTYRRLQPGLLAVGRAGPAARCATGVRACTHQSSHCSKRRVTCSVIGAAPTPSVDLITLHASIHSFAARIIVSVSGLLLTHAGVRAQWMIRVSTTWILARQKSHRGINDASRCVYCRPMYDGRGPVMCHTCLCLENPADDSRRRQQCH